MESFLASKLSPLDFVPARAIMGAYLFGRLDKRVTKVLGPLYARTKTKVAIDLTYACNLKCPSCTRSCSQAPADEFISTNQIDKFIDESLELGKRWERIDLIGGEPTLHPQFMEIFDKIYSYKANYSRSTLIRLRSNVRTKEYKEIAGKLPKDVVVTYQQKNMEYFKRHFYAFNVAPADLQALDRMDPENGCYLIGCGMGLNKYGYYMCGNGAGIDRIFGFNIGRKKIPPNDDEMRDQMRVLCRYCGIFHRIFLEKTVGKPSDKFTVTRSWQAAYAKYSRMHPYLTLY